MLLRELLAGAQHATDCRGDFEIDFARGCSVGEQSIRHVGDLAASGALRIGLDVTGHRTPRNPRPSFLFWWEGVAYHCPGCHAVLGVGIDPIALKTDIVNEVVEALRKD